MNGKIVARLVSALVLIAAIAGIAFFAFQAGVAQGSPITLQAPSGESVPAPYAYHGYGYGFGPRFHHPFGFGFGCIGILITLFLFFFALKAFRFAVWGPRWGWGGHPGGRWSRHWENGVPPMFEEWHKRAHDAPDESKNTDTK